MDGLLDISVHVIEIKKLNNFFDTFGTIILYILYYMHVTNASITV